MSLSHAMQAMILAAGRGERLRPFTDHTPKPLLKVRGIPLIVWHIKNLRAAGVREIVINHAHLGYMVERELGDGQALGVSIIYSHEPEALETAGGIANALHLLKPEPFLVVNGDVFTDFDFSRIYTVDMTRASAHLVLVDNPQHNPAGDFALQGSFVHLQGEPMLTFSGMAIYRPEFFKDVRVGEKAKLSPLLRAAIQEQRVSGEYYGGVWMDVGTPQRLAQLNSEAQWMPAKSSAQ